MKIIKKEELEQILKDHYKVDNLRITDIRLHGGFKLNSICFVMSEKKQTNISFFVAYNLLQYIIKIHSTSAIKLLSESKYKNVIGSANFKEYSNVTLTDNDCENLGHIFGFDYSLLRKFFPEK